MRWRLLLVFCVVLIAGAKCTEVDVTDPKIAMVMTELNTEWRTGYSAMLDEIGTRHFRMDRAAAFKGMQSVLQDLGFAILMTEGDYYLRVNIPAHTMFTKNEWEEIRTHDEPGMRAIATKHLGLKGNLARLEPEGLQIDGVVTMLARGDGVDISITFRLKEIKEPPPESVLPRREYPPPFAARQGYVKIWERFERLVLPMTGLRG